MVAVPIYIPTNGVEWLPVSIFFKNIWWNISITNILHFITKSLENVKKGEGRRNTAQDQKGNKKQCPRSHYLPLRLSMYRVHSRLFPLLFKTYSFIYLIKDVYALSWKNQ